MVWLAVWPTIYQMSKQFFRFPRRDELDQVSLQVARKTGKGWMGIASAAGTDLIQGTELPKHKNGSDGLG